MDRRFGTPLILLASCSLLLAQRAEQENKVPTAAELRAITARGRMLQLHTTSLRGTRQMWFRT